VSAVDHYENTCVDVDALVGVFDADDAGGRAKYLDKLELLAASPDDGDTTCGPYHIHTICEIRVKIAPQERER
jgi:hypothetical protein